MSASVQVLVDTLPEPRPTIQIRDASKLDAALEIHKSGGFTEYECDRDSESTWRKGLWFLGKEMYGMGFQTKKQRGGFSFVLWNIEGVCWNGEGELDLDSPYLGYPYAPVIVMSLFDENGEIAKQVYIHPVLEDMEQYFASKLPLEEVKIILFNPPDLWTEQFTPDDVDQMEFYVSELGLLAQTLCVVFDVHPVKGWIGSGVIA